MFIFFAAPFRRKESFCHASFQRTVFAQTQGSFREGAVAKRLRESACTGDLIKPQSLAGSFRLLLRKIHLPLGGRLRCCALIRAPRTHGKGIASHARQRSFGKPQQCLQSKLATEQSGVWMTRSKKSAKDKTKFSHKPPYVSS